MTSTEISHATAPPKPPAIQTRAQADLLGVYRSRLAQTPAGAWSISDRDAPQGRDRELLMQRRQHLRAFEPAPSKAIGGRISRMFLRFPATANLPPMKAEALVAAYVLDLARYPLWAIDQGIGQIIHGLALKATEFAPSSLDVQKAVREAMAPVQDELTLLSAVLDADVWVDPGDDARSRVNEGFAALLADLTKTNGSQA